MWFEILAGKKKITCNFKLKFFSGYRFMQIWKRREMHKAILFNEKKHHFYKISHAKESNMSSCMGGKKFKRITALMDAKLFC